MTRKCRPDARLRALPLIPVLVLGCLGATAPAAAQDADHLILSEIVTTVNRFGARFIEIVNPTGASVALDDVYLTTGTNVTNSAGYWRIVEDDPTSATAGGGSGGTFHGRFPAGAVIAAGDTITISVTGSGVFATAYGFQPDFEVFEDGLAADTVPELVEVFPGSINAGSLAGGSNVVTLLGSGSVAMYRWDGSSDLVGDLDYAHWGTNAGFRVDKTGYSFDESTYLADTATGAQTPLPGSANDGRSYMRNTASEGTEATPGNGTTGHDETSEVLSATWAVATTQGPAAPPATWLPSAPIFGAVTLSPAAPFDGQAAVVTLALASNTAVNSVVVNYTVDGGPVQTVNAAAAGSQWNATVPAQTEGAVVAWWAVATNAAGVEAVHPAAAPRFVAGWVTEAAPVVGEGPDKLLLTEVCTLGAENEFIEIWNPNAWDVDLSDYYLTDAIYSPANTGYWNIGGGVLNADTIGGGMFTDFHARFPAGFTIAAGDTIVVTIPGSNAFSGAFGFLPDLELSEDDPVPDQVPDMRWLFGTPGENSIVSSGSVPSLTNTGEPVILYHFTPGADLATDIDIFFWGTSTSYRFSKTGITIGGSTYQPDTAVGSQLPFVTQLEFGSSYTRIDATEGGQASTGSNGVGGRDELSEDLATTFAMQPADPSRPDGGEGPGEGGSSVELKVQAKTFLPELGEAFPIQFISRSGSETRLRIFDLNGRLVITLWDSRFDGAPSSIAGAYSTVLWDGRDDTYERVPAGMYVVHLSVVEKMTGEEQTETAPVVVATRLSK